MNRQDEHLLANYFGLEVEVVCRMEQYSLICYQAQKSIVDSGDLCFSRHQPGGVSDSETTIAHLARSA